jgi:hypothetical protein
VRENVDGQGFVFIALRFCFGDAPQASPKSVSWMCGMNQIAKVIFGAAIIAVALGIMSHRIASSANISNDDNQPSRKDDEVAGNSNARSAQPDSQGHFKIAHDSLSAIKEIREGIEDIPKVYGIPKDYPRSMADVKVTPGLASMLEKRTSGYEKFDYKLKLLDRLDSCLGDKSPASGEVIVDLVFEYDRERRVALGIDANRFDDADDLSQVAFRVKHSTLNPEEVDLVVSCLHDAHIGYAMDAEKMLAKAPEEERGFYHPINIKFPLMDDDSYWLIFNDGKPRPKP